jgi:transposase
MKLYAGIDLHSNNHYLGIINEEDKVVFRSKLNNDIRGTLCTLEPFGEELVGIAVESTFNWYWLVDGLMDRGYRVHLANPAAIQQYKGLKHVDDKRSALWLANLLRLGILPEGYIYPKEERPVRDLLRKRSQFIRHRTAHILSIKNIVSRSLGLTIGSNEVKRLEEGMVKDLFREEHLILAVQSSVGIMRYLGEKIRQIEGAVKSRIKLRPEFEGLLTLSGIGEILGLTIMVEVGDIGRFPEVGSYASYCRCVRSSRTSNEKGKGEGNRKNGNKYLAWAYVEAAHFAIRDYPEVQRYYHRKVAKTNQVVAIKAISHKLSRASYYIMRDQVVYDPEKLFHGAADGEQEGSLLRKSRRKKFLDFPHKAY